METIPELKSPPAFTSIETARLVLRRFTMDDLQALVAYRSDPQVARYQSWEAYTEALGAGLIADIQDLEPGLPGRGFQFAVELKDSRALIGDLYLQVEVDEDRKSVV